MPKTRLDVITMALRRLGVVASDVTPDADEEEFAGDTLDGLFEELKTVHEAEITWTLDTTPDAAFLPLSFLLATDIAQHYQIATEPRSRAMGRMRAYLFPSDVTDSRDLDEDGTVTDAEAAAGLRAAYY